MGTLWYIIEVRIIARSTLKAFWEKKNFRDSEQGLKAWYKEVKEAKWKGPKDIKAKYRSASFVGDRVVFNICGNKYRLVVLVRYDLQIVFIRFVGIHEQYDKIDVKEV